MEKSSTNSCKNICLNIGTSCVDARRVFCYKKISPAFLQEDFIRYACFVVFYINICFVSFRKRFIEWFAIGFGIFVINGTFCISFRTKLVVTRFRPWIGD